MGNIFMRFPGGRVKALTLSYDDGVEQDIRLIKIMQRHGMKGTFNLNSGLYAPEGYSWPAGTIHRRMSRTQVRDTYAESGMEVAVHTATHPRLDCIPMNLCTAELLIDRQNLERDFGVIVRGCAYPHGTFHDDVVESVRQCGLAYARTTISTEKFDIPSDWLRLAPTCHHNNPRLMELAKTFAESNARRYPMLFYLWGHAYEFEERNNWQTMEDFAAYMGGRADIWYATNIQIVDYVSAYRQLIFSMDRKKVFNPTATEVFFEMDGQVFSVKPNEMIQLPAGW